jgi:hypothetical protein
MPSPIAFSYTVAPDDQLAFTRYHLRHSERARRNKRKGLFIVPPLLLATGAGLAFLPGWWALSGLVPVLMAAGYVWLYPRAYDQWVLNKTGDMAGQDPSGRFGGTQKMAVMPEGLALETPKGKAGVPWNKVREVVIAEAHIFVYLDEVNALIIPESGVEGASFEQIAATIQEYAGGGGTGHHTVSFG